jgi:DNA invertase Pin-like site-specific DNA recombinase
LGKDLIPHLKAHDVLIVAEISRLGRSLLDVLTTLKTLAERKVQVHVVKNGFVLDQSLNSKIITTVLGLTAEIERELLSLRVKEGQARARERGYKIGRPKGSGGYSKLDKHADQIKAHAAKGITKLNLARIFDCDWITMNRWLQRHGVRIEKGVRR